MTFRAVVLPRSGQSDMLKPMQKYLFIAIAAVVAALFSCLAQNHSPLASCSLRSFVSGAQAIDTIMPMKRTPASAIIAA